MKSNRTSSPYEFEIFLFQFDDMMLVIYYIYTLIREIISNAEGPCLCLLSDNAMSEPGQLSLLKSPGIINNLIDKTRSNIRK